MRGCSDRVRIVAVILALSALPGLALAKEKAGKAGANPAGAPDQMDFFQSLSLGSNKEPININSDSLELDYKGSVLTYAGNVKVTQGDVTLTSDKLTITYDRQAVQRSPAPQASPDPQASPAARRAGTAGTDANKIKEVVAEGHVRIVRGDRIAEGRRAVFDQAQQTIVLSDNAVLHEGLNKVAGDRIVVYLREERSVVESGNNSRVSAVFYPNAGASPAATPAAVQVGERR